MTLERVAQNGLVLLGCGKMGTALLTGWLAAGVPPGSVWVIEPNPTDWLKSTGVHLNAGIPATPAVAATPAAPATAEAKAEVKAEAKATKEEKKANKKAAKEAKKDAKAEVKTDKKATEAK